ncbi:DNA polymerase I [Sulfurimonas sp. HSL-3221]|uniref:DNA polymerase I n=1 Tax=Thiomicrolovo sulfuroxydans TaxID=2894755 RepID=UPI001E5063A9|nr:DNA polymerase I [Sulfurimonas sp. HSL-3221]UFS63666.1 DNA polymerase I [Sulfurimonas sp. HSL-3221]
MPKTITVIDTFGFFFRSFYALPPLTNKEGFPTGLLTGFINFIDRLHQDHASDYIVFALDAKGPTFRNEIDPEYKAHRPPPPDELKAQLPIAIEWIEKMGFKTLMQSGFEADDMIASITKKAVEAGMVVRIVSHDKDLYQLIDDDRVVLVDAIKRKDVNETECLEKYGIRPEQFTDYQALLGDSADNVPGVKGIGKVTAQKLLNQYETLDNVYANLDEVKPAGVQKKLREGEENAWMSRKLVTLRDDLFEKVAWDEYDMDDGNPFLPIVPELIRYEMNGIIRKLKAKKLISEEEISNENAVQEAECPLPANAGFSAKLITDESELAALTGAITAETLVAFDTETTGLDYLEDTMVGFSFCLNAEEAYYVPVGHSYLGVPEQVGEAAASAALRQIFTGRVVGHNLKFDLHFVNHYMEGFEPSLYADTMVMAWLAAPESPLSLDKLAQVHLNHTMISFKETVKKGEDFSGVDLADACGYAAEDAWATLMLYEKLTALLDLQGEHLLEEAAAVEFPFSLTLGAMEEAGIKVDTKVLATFLEEAKERLAELTQSIYELSGSEFNINSTKQLGEVLFEKLELPVVKKTKTGYSTDEKVLSSLLDAHPVIEKLLSYRELHKLVSTYLDPLLQLGAQRPDGRIHTSYVQTGTATGRLSSKNPNLQNIPTRTPLGARIREAFVAEPGKKLIGIDYSQIELRLLAHFSEDPTLVDAFKHDKDIHLSTAIALFGEEEAPKKRSIAKTVNFGLLYGMGQKKLSDTLGITTKEAREIITRYFETFPTVKSYFASIVERSKEQGYVETLLGRRRYFDYDKATPMLKAAYERESVNTVFQGSAADLIKMAMNRIDDVIKKERLPATMLLQIHDELIFEADAAQADALGQRFQSIMEEIHPLHIPLRASLNIGAHWGELK